MHCSIVLVPLTRRLYARQKSGAAMLHHVMSAQYVKHCFFSGLELKFRFLTDLSDTPFVCSQWNSQKNMVDRLQLREWRAELKGPSLRLPSINPGWVYRWADMDQGTFLPSSQDLLRGCRQTIGINRSLLRLCMLLCICISKYIRFGQKPVLNSSKNIAYRIRPCFQSQEIK